MKSNPAADVPVPPKNPINRFDISMHYEEDTIAALATPAASGAICVIRVSGDKSLAAVHAIFRGKANIMEAISHTIHYGRIVDSEEQMIDDVTVSVFRRPHSYTGEDSAEITLHGNPLIAEKIMARLLALGARVALPGEFTKRAFLNGRLDLVQAEAVCDLIASRTEASLKGARNQMNGLLSKKIGDMRGALTDIAALLELELDFAEEDISLASRDDLLKRLSTIAGDIDALVASYRFGKILRDGIHVSIIGEPNVGKSSLLNYFLKENRAIVSDIPGTTRDIIREELSYDGLLFILTDTAGLREASDAIEKEGVERSEKAVKESDFVLFIGDPQKNFSDAIYRKLSSLIAPERIIRVLNKIDTSPSSRIDCDVKISAVTGDGIVELLDILKTRTRKDHPYTEHSLIVTNIRHIHALGEAVLRLREAAKSLDNNVSQEFVALDIRAAIEELEEIIGRVTSEDILNNIFSKFCIGK